MKRPRVVIVDSDLPGDTGESDLKEHGFEVARAKTRSTRDILEAAHGADALIVQWQHIGPDLMDQLPDLRLISRLGIGYDMVDVDAATERGIAVANTPAYCIEEVATHTLALALSLARGVHRYDRSVRNGAWQAASGRPAAMRPSSTRALVVGFGRIGSAVARSLAAIGFDVKIHDPFVSAEQIRREGFHPVELDAGLRECELVTLHLPLTTETRHLLGRERLEQLPVGAYVVNTCRGGLIDEAALVDLLREGHLGGAGLDVFEEEPLPPDHPLLQLDQVIITPHAAWYSEPAVVDLPRHAALNVIQFLRGDHVGSIVNRDYTRFATSEAVSS